MGRILGSPLRWHIHSRAVRAREDACIAPADGTGAGQYFWAITKYGTATCPSYSGLTGTYWTIYTRPEGSKAQYGSTRMNKKGGSCDGDAYAAAMKWCTP